MSRRPKGESKRCQNHCSGCNAPGLLQESLGPFGPEVFRECPSGCLRGSRVSKQWPESVPGVSKRCPGHSGGHSGAQGAKGPRDTPKDTLGTLRARRARETPVAARGLCNVRGGKTFPRLFGDFGARGCGDSCKGITQTFVPDIFGAKKFGMSFEAQGNQTLWRDIPGFLPGYPSKRREV